MLKSLEHHEHAEHMAHGKHHGDEHAHGDKHAEAPTHAEVAAHDRRNQMAALLVAILAASLAVTEQGAKHAEIRVQVNSVLATDAWAQYQAKSTRGTLTGDLAGVVGVMDAGDPALMDRRKVLLEKFKQDQDRFENDPKDGKRAIAMRARAFEEERDRSLEQTHAYHNGTASIELGIVLATASAIIKSKMLIYIALGFGLAGVVCGFLGWLAPEYGAI